MPKAPAGTEAGDRESFGDDIVARLSPELVGGPSEEAAQALTEQGWAVTIDEWAGVPPTFTPDLLWNRITLRTCDGTVVAVVFDEHQSTVCTRPCPAEQSRPGGRAREVPNQGGWAQFGR